MGPTLLLVLLALAATTVGCDTSSFSEKVTLTPLGDGSVASHHTFRWSSSPDHTCTHYSLFPKPFGEAMADTNTSYVRLSLASTPWDASRWGRPLLDAPVGSVLRAHHPPAHGGGEEGEEGWWRHLVGDLAGLFCASLELMAYPSTSRVDFGLSDSITPSSVRSGFLPREGVCTENLTPWLKLLPGTSGRSRAGLAFLLSPLRVFHVRYHALAVEYSADAGMVFSLVLVHTHGGSENGRASPRSGRRSRLSALYVPGMFAPHHESGLSPAYNDSITPSPLATESSLEINLPSRLSGPPSLPGCQHEDQSNMYVCDLKRPDGPGSLPPFVFSLDPTPDPRLTPWPDHDDGVRIRRYLTGSVSAHGGIETCVANTNADKDLVGVYTEITEPYLIPYFHTLRSWGGGHLSPRRMEHGSLGLRPIVLELDVVVHPESELCWSVEFDKRFLHLSQYPPDPHRGFDLSPGAFVVSAAGGGSGIYYSDALLLHVPTPDFSMPYNVITLTCTVMALFFGSMFNTLIRPQQLPTVAAAPAPEPAAPQPPTPEL